MSANIKMLQICPACHLLEEQSQFEVFFPQEREGMNYKGGNIVYNLCADYIFVLKVVKVPMWSNCSTDRFKFSKILRHLYSS